MTPAGTYAARSGTMNFLNNLMVGATSEGLQEMSEQVLTDAALASIAAIRGDADKMARVGFLREGYLNDLAVAGLAGAFLGGPTGTVTRAGAQAEQRANPTESSQWSAEEKAVYLEQKSQRQKQASQDEYNRQTAVAESRTEDLEKVSNEDLMYAMLNPIVDDDASLIHAGRDGGRFRVTP